MMASDSLDIAKEITLACLAKMEVGANKTAEVYGEEAGKLFKIAINKVVEAFESRSSFHLIQQEARLLSNP